jgi:predicted acylesterase/phospholipase RssA
MSMIALWPAQVDSSIRWRRTIAIAATAVLAQACSIEPPAVGAAISPKRCSLSLETMAPRGIASKTAIGLAEKIKNGMSETSAEMLILSGGSENGAYGAGFLSEWAKSRNGRLPDFRVVTGVSTGALQASAAFAGDPSPMLEGGYLIERESDLLLPYSGVTGGPKPSARRIATALIRHGALANLAPVRARFRKTLGRTLPTDGSATLMQAVARKAETGALLYVGVVDMDSGQAVAIDLSELAVRWKNAPDDQKPVLEDCYLDAVMASSSAPMAAPPVFIDGHMYADGGLRFGMFADEVADAFTKPTGKEVAATDVMTLDARPSWRPRSYLIVNTHLDFTPRCPELVAATETPKTEPCFADGVHRGWRFDQIALESERIFANQVYRFSKERLVERIGVLSTQIPADAEIAERLDSYPELAGKTCAYWRALDDAELRPVQFHPRYMRCMIDVGRQRYREARW